jgi:hypothetical protein
MDTLISSITKVVKNITLENKDKKGLLVHRRRTIIVAFILLIAVQTLVVTYLGDKVMKSRSLGQAMSLDMELLSDHILDLAILMQTNELKHLSESWHNWGSNKLSSSDWDSAEWQSIYAEFSNKMTAGRSGPDGERLVITFLSYEDGTVQLLQASDRGLPWAQELSTFATLENDYLHPRFITTRTAPTDHGEPTIYWNKLVVPTPTSFTPKLVIFYGFSEEVLFKKVSARYVSATASATKIVDNLESTVFAISVLMVSLILLGMIISISLRQVEGEVFANELPEGGR